MVGCPGMMKKPGREMSTYNLEFTKSTGFAKKLPVTDDDR
jgi:hypothetical protein